MHRVLPSTLALILVACGSTFPEPDPFSDPPLGMALALDGRTYAGFARVDLTPELGETFEDRNGDSYFDGCLDDPLAEREGCSEPFDDRDGDGVFEPTWIAGFGPLRPAQGIHDPVDARALVLSRDGEYVILLALDFVGLGRLRIEELRGLLEAEGVLGDRLIAASSHNHQGPDVVGLWGNPTLGDDAASGVNPAYQDSLAPRMFEAVREAAGSMVPVEASMAAQPLRERSPWWNGEVFGGKNPTATMRGLIHDIRDPLIVSDQLFVMHLAAADGSGAVATFVNWAGHPEVRGSGSEISSDYVHWLREHLERTLGGGALFFPESLGGMQSALGGDVPGMTLGPDGLTAVPGFQTCSEPDTLEADHDCFGAEVGSTRRDGDGDAVPVWPEGETWEFAESLGLQLAVAAIDLLDEAPRVDAGPIRVRSAPLFSPIDNLVFQLLIRSGQFEAPVELLNTDPRDCPSRDPADPLHPGCVPNRTWRVRIGPMEFATAPGELFPELFWGLPDDERFEEESADVTRRGRARASRWFPQHDPDCDVFDWEDCRRRDGDMGACSCLSMHAVPYRARDDADFVPIVDLLEGDFRFAVSNAGDYLGYLVPEPDFNTRVSLLSDDGDHYEDTVSASPDHGTLLLDAQLSMGRP